MMELAQGLYQEDLSFKNPRKLMLWIAMGAMFMAFAGLTSAVIVSRGGAKGTWFNFDLPSGLWVSTTLILLASVSMVWAVSGAKRDNQLAVKLGTTLALGLSIGFCFSQLNVWKEAYASGVVLSNSDHDKSQSFFYLLTFFHLLHVLGGVISLLYVWIKSLVKKSYKPGNVIGLELSATYWHFVDAVWVFLFIFLYLIR